MERVSKSAPTLVFVAILLAVCLIGWVARAALAQDPPKATDPPSFPAATTAPEPAIPQTAPVPQSEGPKQAPSLEAVEPAPAAEIVSPASRPDPVSVRSEAAVPGQRLAPDAGILVGSAGEDPEKAALAFVEQNQKMAESQLKNLKAEEAKLGVRLRKVEAGIKRWESLLGALKQSQGSVAVGSPAAAGNWKHAEPIEPGTQRVAPADPELLPKSKVREVREVN